MLAEGIPAGKLSVQFFASPNLDESEQEINNWLHNSVQEERGTVVHDIAFDAGTDGVSVIIVFQDTNL